LQLCEGYDVCAKCFHLCVCVLVFCT